MTLPVCTVLFFVYCFAISISTESEPNLRFNLFRRNPALNAELVVEQLAVTTSSLKSAYDNNELHNAGDIALVLVESIPILGDIMHIFSGKHDTPFDIENGIKTINSNLKTLNTNIKNLGTRVNKLSNEIDLSVLKNQVANDKREISNCYDDFLLFLEHPINHAEQDRVKNCYSKFGYVRQIGSILSNNKLTFMQKPLFDQIIEVTGYCDGKRIKEVYLYLMGIYIEGCSSLITSETLTYGNDSTTYEDECTSTLHTAQDALAKLFENCKLEPCDRYLEIMTKTLELEKAADIPFELKDSFPWFSFEVVTMKKGLRTGLALHNIDNLDYLTLSKGGLVYRLLLWSQYNETLNSEPGQFYIQFTADDLESIYNGMALRTNTTNGQTTVSGHLNALNVSNPACKHNINTDGKTDGDLKNKIKNFLSNDQNVNVSLPGWAIAIIAIGVVIFVVMFGICFFKIMCG